MVRVVDEEDGCCVESAVAIPQWSVENELELGKGAMLDLGGCQIVEQTKEHDQIGKKIESSTKTSDSPLKSRHSAPLIQKVRRGFEWVKLKFHTKVYPGNVQGILPRLLLLAVYASAFGIIVWLISEEVENVRQAYENPLQTIKSEELYSFPAFDIQICPVPKLRYYDPADVNTYTYKFFSRTNSTYHVFHPADERIVDTSTSAAQILSPDGTLMRQIVPDTVESVFHGFSHRCAQWKLSEFPYFFEKEAENSLIMNVNITGAVAGQVDLIIAPAIRGHIMEDDLVQYNELAFSGSSVTVPHPSIVALGASARIYHHLRDKDDEGIKGVNEYDETQVTFGAGNTRTVAASDADGRPFTQIQIHPNLGGLNHNCWVVRESVGTVLSPAIAAVLATVTLMFSVFRYLFPRSPLVPVYFRWSTARKYLELQASQSARRECQLPYPVYSDRMTQQSDLHLMRLSDLQRQSSQLLDFDSPRGSAGSIDSSDSNYAATDLEGGSAGSPCGSVDGGVYALPVLDGDTKSGRDMDMFKPRGETNNNPLSPRQFPQPPPPRCLNGKDP